MKRLRLALIFAGTLLCTAVGAQPARVISLAVPSSQILDALDLDSAVVGIDKFSRQWVFPLRNVQVLSSGTTFSVEQILSLKPTMLISWWYQDVPAELLSRSGVRCISYRPRTPKDVHALILEIARQTGRDKQGEHLVETLKYSERQIRRTKPAIRPLIYVEFESTGKTAGPATFSNAMIELAGGENVGARFRVDYPTVTDEQIIHLNPDIILLVKKDGNRERFADRPGWKKINAVMHGMVFSVPPELMTPGPRFIEGAEFINRCVSQWSAMQKGTGVQKER